MGCICLPRNGLATLPCGEAGERNPASFEPLSFRHQMPASGLALYKTRRPSASHESAARRRGRTHQSENQRRASASGCRPLSLALPSVEWLPPGFLIHLES